MRIVSQSIRGYQSFKSSGTVFYQEGMNIIVGQNNSGKSSLLSALKTPLKDDRHREKGLYKHHLLPPPSVEITMSVSGGELKSAVLRKGAVLDFPIPNDVTVDSEFREQYTNLLFSKEVIEFKFERRSGIASVIMPYPSHGLFTYDVSQPRRSIRFQPSGGTLGFEAVTQTDSFPDLIDWLWKTDCFFFDAERYRIGRSVQIHSERLNSDASNLPSVIATLAGEKGTVLGRLIDHLREIFATFGNLSVRPVPGGSNNIEILIWPTTEMDSAELGFALDASGTGVSQVLAILVAVMTLENCVIVIDEINSFLHPAAVKSLLRILNESYSQHQYIISTHAPEVISFSNNRAFFVVKKTGYNSEVKTVDLRQRGNFRDVADLLGITMTDVFAADKVIWVEGATEEMCFPLIYKSQGLVIPSGLVISSVTTGDFNLRKRDKAIIYEIYTKLSRASASLATTVAFSFDAENLTQADRDEMIKQSSGLLCFLPRRHLECFLIYPAAIASFLNIREDHANATHKVEHVEQALIAAASDGRYSPAGSWSGDLFDVSWLEKVDAANLINYCCSQLTEARVIFRKKSDSLYLVQFLIENDEEFLDPLRRFVIDLVNRSN